MDNKIPIAFISHAREDKERFVISFAEKHLAEFKEQLKKSSGSSCLPYMKKVDLALERAYKEGTPLYELDDEFVDLKKEFNLANLYYLRRLYRQE